MQFLTTREKGYLTFVAYETREVLQDKDFELGSISAALSVLSESGLSCLWGKFKILIYASLPNIGNEKCH